jgi:hypothetical protein
MRVLPRWCITHQGPAFYDTESATAVEQTAKVYGAMQELINEYNEFVSKIETEINDFEASTNKNYDEFTTRITKIIHDYIKMIDEKIKLQDVKINESIVFIKDNLEVSIKTILEEMSTNGELDSIILSSLSSIESSIESVNSELTSMKETYDNQINTLINDVSELQAKINVIYNEESESLIIGGEI